MTHPVTTLGPEAPTTKRGLERRLALLLAGHDLFLQHGYDAVSLDDIVQFAGGSKASIYKYFGNKEGLFSAICDYRRERLFNDICLPFTLAQDHLHDYLLQTLTRFYLHLTQPENIAFLRVFMEQSERNPTLAEYLYNKCATRMQHDLADVLAQCHAAKIIYCEQPLYSAILCFGILGDIEWKILMGVPLSSNDPVQLDYIQHCVKLFLAAHQYHQPA